MWHSKLQPRWVLLSLVIGGVLCAVAQQPPPPLPAPIPQPAPQSVQPQPATTQAQTPVPNAAPPATPAPVIPNPLAVVAPPPNPTNLVADADTKKYSAKPGDAAANFTFTLTNISSAPIIINAVSTSCGCTVAKVPTLPWNLDAGTNGTFDVSVNLAGKAGTFTKTLTVVSSVGNKSLSVEVTMPPPVIAAATNNVERDRNMELAKADRQAVFKGDCAKCHGEPAAQNKSGKDLYVAVCGVCHDAEHRATAVPDLHALKTKPDEPYWRNWINAGKIGTMMPAFAKAEGGPLNEEQINSLVHYLSHNFATVTAQTTPARSVIVQPSIAPGLQPVPVRR
jgi:mono/diheme cytochrome c family protein